MNTERQLDNKATEVLHMKKMKGFLALFLVLAMACTSLAVFAEDAQGMEPAEATPGGDGNNGKPTTDDAIIIENGTPGNFAVKIDDTVLVDEKNQMANYEGVEFTYSEVDPATGDPVTITIDGNFDTPDEAITVRNDTQDRLLVSIDGNITGEDRGIDLGLHLNNENTAVNVTGNVMATETYSSGVFLDVSNGTGTVSVMGDVTGQGFGVFFNQGDHGSTRIVNVTGNVTAEGKGGYGIQMGGAGENVVYVNGDVIAQGDNSCGAGVIYNSDLTVTGDLYGSEMGLNVRYSGNRDILVEGTISGKTGVECGYTFNGENTDLTVWQIASTKEDAAEADLVVNSDYSGSVTEEDLTVFCQQSIHYIVKLLQPTEGGTVWAQKENGDALDKHHELETAQEGDKVYVNVEAIDNYRILKALNGDTELDKDEGGFFCKVRRGGGILLTAILEKITPPEPEPQPQPMPEPKPEPVAKAGQVQVSSTVKTVEVRDAENRISISFLSDGTFKVRMEDGTTEKGTYRNENGRLVLICGGSTVTVGGDGTFTYTSQQNPGKSYTFRLSPADMEKLLKATR